jgi:hypothetical protein
MRTRSSRPWDSALAKQTLKAPMPNRTDLANSATIENIDQHPTLAKMTPGADSMDFVRARASTQLTPGPYKSQ